MVYLKRYYTLINYYIICVVVTLSLFVVSSCENELKQKKKDSISLSEYKNRDFFGIVDSTIKQQFPFINCKLNHYQFYNERSPNFEKLYYDVKQMVYFKDRKLNFYHIGGSHLQADVYTNDMRNYLQSNWEGLTGERGIIFPFDLAQTNSPMSYKFTSPNQWTAYKSTITRSDSVKYGLMGMVIESEDSIINIHFKYHHTKIKSAFDRIRIYHNKGVIPYEIKIGIDDSLILKNQTNENEGYTDIHTKEEINQFHLKMKKNKDYPFKFRIYGFQLYNNEPGISYTTIGVNGASLPTYLKNTLFIEQLKETPPDFFAFSIGTNDANVPYDIFNPNQFKQNLDTLIRKVLSVNPNCAVLLTVPNDAYFMKNKPNKNITREREMIIELAKKYHAAVWDFYGIMGGGGSSKKWQKNKLMRTDLIHFTAKGYHLKGDLFFESFIKWLEQMDIRDRQILGE